MNDPPRILVIDDDLSVRKSLARYFRLLGNHADTLSSAEGMQLAQIDRYDCVIVDIQLPGTSGLELVAQLRKSGHKVPVVLITANQMSEEEQTRIRMEAPLLMKPFSVEALGTAVTRAIKGR